MDSTTAATPASAAPAPAAAAAAAAAGEHKETTKGAIAEKFAQAALLDMVFVMDCTGSMGSYIASAQSTIADIIQQIVSAERADVRFGLVAYRDHPPQDSTFVTNVYDFTTSIKTMRTNLGQLSANGGGDGPEAVVDGLQAALKLEYREEATKVVILIADAPPHGLGMGGDGFPNGCPCGLDPMVVCRQMAEQNIALYCIGCEPSISPYKNFFMAMAHVTGGQYCPLGDAHVLSSAVVSGVCEEISLAAAMAEVKVAVAECEHMDEAAQAEFVHNKLKSKNIRSKQMKQEGGPGGSAAAPTLTDDAIAMSKATSLADIRGKYNMGDMGSGGACDMFAFGGCEGGMAPAMACSAAPMSMMAPSSSSRMKRACAPSAPVMFAAAALSSSSAPPPSGYAVEEADVSMAQTARLMNKARFQKK